MFSGLRWRGIGLIALLCALNALRRTVDDLYYASLPIWLFRVAILFATGLVLALPIALAVVWTYNRVPARPLIRYPALLAAVMASSAVSVVLMLGLERRLLPGSDPQGVVAWASAWPRYALLALLFSVVYASFRRAEQSAADAREAERERVLLDEQMRETELQVLQAQIEPHFLFNTLATVRRLYETDRTAAASMLDNLMRYLTVALPQMRAAESTLGRELSLAEAYLSVQRIRMGRRLTFAVDVGESLRGAYLPPMMLVTLAENAVKHGLSPLPEGGYIRISARLDGEELRVQVSDSGRGFTKTSGGGTGLANIRARLSAAHGSAGRLSVRLNSPRGVTATISLPYSTAEAA